MRHEIDDVLSWAKSDVWATVGRSTLLKTTNTMHQKLQRYKDTLGMKTSSSAQYWLHFAALSKRLSTCKTLDPVWRTLRTRMWDAESVMVEYWSVPSHSHPWQIDENQSRQKSSTSVLLATSQRAATCFEWIWVSRWRLKVKQGLLVAGSQVRGQSTEPPDFF